MVFPLSTIKKFHAEIVFVAWPRDLSWEVKIVFGFFFFFFLRRHLQKILYPSVILFACFLLQILSAFAIIFANCHGLSCVHVRASSYTALFRVSLRGVGHKCVGLAQKISARCNTGFYVFSFFFICIFNLLLALSHMHVFFPRCVPSDLEVGYEKSILTRTEKNPCYLENLFRLHLCLKLLRTNT